MKFDDLFTEEQESHCEVIYLNEKDEIIFVADYDDYKLFLENSSQLNETTVRQFRRIDNVLKRQYRCTSGPKKGMIVSSPEACGKRKNPKRRFIAKRIAKIMKNVRIRKTKISKKKSISKMVSKLNKRLRGQ